MCLGERKGSPLPPKKWLKNLEQNSNFILRSWWGAYLVPLALGFMLVLLMTAGWLVFPSMHTGKKKKNEACLILMKCIEAVMQKQFLSRRPVNKPGLWSSFFYSLHQWFFCCYFNGYISWNYHLIFIPRKSDVYCFSQSQWRKIIPF